MLGSEGEVFRCTCMGPPMLADQQQAMRLDVQREGQRKGMMETACMSNGFGNQPKAFVGNPLHAANQPLVLKCDCVRRLDLAVYEGRWVLCVGGDTLIEGIHGLVESSRLTNVEPSARWASVCLRASDPASPSRPLASSRA